MRKLIFAAALGCFLVASAGATRAQSLADIARKERAKKGSATKTEKVFTNDDMPRATSLEGRTSATPAPSSEETSIGETAPAEAKPATSPAPSDEKSAAEEKPAEDKIKTKEFWQSKFAAARAVVARADQELLLSQDELNLSQMNEARELDPNLRSQLSQEVTSKQSEVDVKQAADDKAKQALADLQKEFDESGAPQEWLPAEEAKQ